MKNKNENFFPLRVQVAHLYLKGTGRGMQLPPLLLQNAIILAIFRDFFFFSSQISTRQ